MTVQKTQIVTTLLVLTNVPVKKAIMGTEENVKVCKWFDELVQVYVPRTIHKIFILHKIRNEYFCNFFLSLYTPG